MSNKKGIWIPIELINDKNLDWPNKVLLSEIYSLGKMKKGCFASNNHFGKLLGFNKSAASKRITRLVEMGYITSENHDVNNVIIGRTIKRSSPAPNNSMVPSKPRGSSRKTKGVVPTDLDPSSEGKPINSSINSDLLNHSLIHTGASILGEKNDEQKQSIQITWYLEALEESTTFLTGATELGVQILEFTNPEKHSELIKLVGEHQFNLISAQMSKYQFATENLNRIKSSSTEGKDAAAE